MDAFSMRRLQGNKAGSLLEVVLLALGFAFVVLVHMMYLVRYWWNYLDNQLMVSQPPVWFLIFPALSVLVLVGAVWFLVGRLRGRELSSLLLLTMQGVALAWIALCLLTLSGDDGRQWVVVGTGSWPSVPAQGPITVPHPATDYSFFVLIFVTWCMLFLGGRQGRLLRWILCIPAWAGWIIMAEVLSSQTLPSFVA